MSRRERRTGPAHVTASALVLLLLLPLLLPGLGSASGSDPGPESPSQSDAYWPPEAWRDGNFSELSLVELALLASDSAPTPENRQELAQGLLPLDKMPPEHTELTRVVLEGLGKARWHQMQAMRDLSNEQRALVAAAHPDKPLPSGWDEVMATVDHRELAKALVALESASARALAIFDSLREKTPQPGIAETLAEATGAPLPAALPVVPVEPPTVEATAALVVQATGIDLDPDDLAYLHHSLNQMPSEARGAVHLIMEGLVPFKAGVPTDAYPALVALGAAVDAAQDTLRLWSTAAMAQQIHHVQTGPGIVIPDADADRPPLHFGVPRLRHPDAPLPPAPTLPDAVRELALAFGDHETARNAAEEVQPVMDVLPQSGQDAIAQMFTQGARYIKAHQVANQIPAPHSLSREPGNLETWAGYLDGGLPEPGSDAADDLLAARPFLAARLEAALAREDLMTAIQDAVTELTPQPQPQSSSSSSPVPDEPDLPAPTMPMSGPAQEAGLECPQDLGILTVARYLAIEPCGTDTQWNWDNHRAVFVIDVGGNDTYQGPFGRAPFRISTPGGGPVSSVPASSPLAIHLDLGGSDTYNAAGHDCALGSVCQVDGSSVPPLAILVDWNDNGVEVRNEFHAGNQSLGHANGSGALGLLVERVGKQSYLKSEYVSDGRSQGAAVEVSSVGALLRLVGSRSNATGEFNSGSNSQGSTVTGSLTTIAVIAALVNIAGTNAQSHDRYVAGDLSQGALVTGNFLNPDREIPQGVALFADIVGSGGRSDDIYIADNRSRAYGPGAYFFDLLLPEKLDTDDLVHVSSLDISGVPGLDDLDIGASVHVASTGSRSSSDDTFMLAGGAGHGMSSRPNSPGSGLKSTLFMNLGGNTSYIYGGEELGPCSEDDGGFQISDLPANECIWQQGSNPGGTAAPTGIDSDVLRDADTDFFPYFLEELLGSSDDNPDDVHPTGRRVVFDLGARYPFLNETHAFVLSLTGDNVYGPGFSSAVLLDLAGNDEHLGRTAAATGPLAADSNDTFARAAQNLLSFTLDMEGDDIYRSPVNGSLGFGAGNAVGILFDLGGNDRYNGTSFTQGVGVDGGLGVLVDLKRRVDPESSSLGDPLGPERFEVNRFRADGAPAQGHGSDGGVGLLVADGDHNEFEDGESEFPLPTLRELWDLLPELGGVSLPSQVEGALEEHLWPNLPPEVRDAIEDARGAVDDADPVGTLRDFLEAEVIDAIEQALAGLCEEDDAFCLPRNVTLPGGWHQSDSGGSVNMGDNTAPRITDWGIRNIWDGTGSIPSLNVAVPYVFHADVSDDDGDRLEVCWTFGSGDPEEPGVDQFCEHVEGGEGTVEVEYAWEAVHTDFRNPTIRDGVPYGFGLSVENPGGLRTQADASTIVHNPPPEITDGGILRGPSSAKGSDGSFVVSINTPHAFQVPFVPGDDSPDPDAKAAEVDWGDGRFDSFISATAVDWAKSDRGARIEVPDRFPDGNIPEFNPENLPRAIDGSSNFIQFRHNRDEGGNALNAPATVAVWFDGLRQVRQVSVDMARDGDSSVEMIRVMAEGVRADGSTLPLGLVRLIGDDFNTTTWDLPGFPDLEGIVLRQIVAHGDRDKIQHFFSVRDVSALGPGAFHTWTSAGVYNVNYTVIDRFGGRNGTLSPIVVLGDELDGEGPADSVSLVDIGGRGSTLHATLAADTSYELTVNVPGTKENQGLCMDWGDNTGLECEHVPTGGTMEFEKTWEDSGDYPVWATYCPSGLSDDGCSGEGSETLLLTTVHVEQAIDLRVGVEEAQFFPINTHPFIFLTFEERPSWHEGLVTADAEGNSIVTQYQAIVDAGGDDRFLGRVASSTEVFPHPIFQGILPGVPVPSLLVSAGGNDDYLSVGPRAQSFADHFGVALLVDAGGNDTYVASGQAQAAATRGGVAGLISLGGQDVFNPVPADHSAVAAASARHQDLWLDPPAVLRSLRPLGTGPDFVQGAADDGVALLVTSGERTTFHAGQRSQGHGSHQVPNVDHYVIPGAGEDCGSLPGVAAGPAVNANTTGASCRLGISNLRTDDPEFYTRFNGQGSDEPPDGFWCTNFPGLTPCVNALPDSSILSAFLSSGPRYGPGLGAMVRLNGPAIYHAGSETQGSAGPAGRGLLLDLDGGSSLLAGKRGQAFSAAGTAGAVLGGSSVLRLGAEGQAMLSHSSSDQGSVTTTSGPEAGLTPKAAILLTFGDRHARCDNCSQSVPEDSFIMDENGESLRLPGPDVTVTVPNGLHSGGTIDVAIAVSANENPVEVVVLATAYPKMVEGGCTGAALAAPTLLKEGMVTSQFNVVLDLGAVVGGIDPLLPAGCTEIHAFARPALGQDIGGLPFSVVDWGIGNATTFLLPPPRGLQVEKGLLTTTGEQGTGMDFKVDVNEPLALLPEGNRPNLEFNVTNGDENNLVFDVFSDLEWKGKMVEVAWKWSGNDDFDDFPEGEYGLAVRAKWPDELFQGEESDWSQWLPLDDVVVLVDRNPPIVEVRDNLPSEMRLGHPVIVHGTAQDTSGVDMVMLRFLDEKGEVRNVTLSENGVCPGQTSKYAHSISTSLIPHGASEVTWGASICVTPDFSAGNLTLQVAGRDSGGATGTWETVASIRVDSGAPEVKAVFTSDGFQAAGPSPETDNRSVQLLVHLWDPILTPSEAHPNPVAGVGVDERRVAVSAARIMDDDLERLPLERNATLDEEFDDGSVLLGYTWSSEHGEVIPEGNYELFILARDKVGNLFDHNPGRVFAVDRTPPELGTPTAVAPLMTRPDGEVVPQGAFKAGDEVTLRFFADDANPHNFTIWVPGNTTTVDWTEEGLQEITLGIPAGADDGTGRVDVQVLATDLAGNTASTSLPEGIVFHAEPLAFDQAPQLDVRSDSVAVHWVLDRALDGPGDGSFVVLRYADNGTLVAEQPGGSLGGATYEARFTNLLPDTSYLLDVQVWDGANHTLAQTVNFATLPVAGGTSLTATTDTRPTYSGRVALDGSLFAGVAEIQGELSLHVDSPEAESVPFALAPDHDQDGLREWTRNLAQGAREDFTLYWDSREHVPPGTGAREVTMVLRFDDGSSSWHAPVTLRIDNTPPRLEPAVTGPELNGGWYNGTVVVRIDARDDTGPLRYETVLDDGPRMDADRVTLAEDGVYTIDFTVWDDAIPPNRNQTSHTVRVDRTLPGLEVTSGLPDPWTNQTVVPVTVSASDEGSGLDGYRVRAGNLPWSLWDHEALVDGVPLDLAVSLDDLPDAEHWIDVEVRDVARNVERQTIHVILDRTPPTLVDARWIGWSAGEKPEPVLHVVANDRVEGAGRPSGVDAIRFASFATGSWSVWEPTGTSGVFPVAELSQGAVWLQLRDRAGNVGEPVRVEAALPPAPGGEGAKETGDVPVGTLLRLHDFAPEDGTTETEFTFFLVVRPLEGVSPDDVMLHIAGESHAMHPDGPRLDGGGRLWATTIHLPPTGLDERHSYFVAVRYGDHVVEGPVLAGPSVFRYDAGQALGAAADEDARGLPGLALLAPMVLLLLILPILDRRRRNP